MVLTGGAAGGTLPRMNEKQTPGNMVVAQSGGPSMVINQSLVGAALAARWTKQIGHVWGARHGIDGILKEDFVDLGAIPEATLEAVARTPSSALGSVRHKPTPEECRRIFDVLRARDVRFFFYIGGNDSAETVHVVAQEARRAKFDLACFHIPKTIDNDLRGGNDHTPGYGSAARFVAMALQGDDLDSRALGGVKIDVIMGRDAGFLTAASALGRRHPDDGPHLIYLPERPFDIARFADDVKATVDRLGRCVVAVSEGIRGADGVPVAVALAGNAVERDSHGNAQLSGTGALGDLLAREVKARTGIRRVRADTFGYLQRSFPGAISEADAAEARTAGSSAVAIALCGGVKNGSVAIVRKPGPGYHVEFRRVPLSSVARATRSMPAKFIAANGHDVTRAFLDYARPLVGELPHMELL